MGLLERAGRLAEATGADRYRYVDFLRVAALGAVVVGHWLVIDVQLQDGLPTGSSVLGTLRWAHWMTWMFQVIPVFFLIGGYANTASWRSHRRRGGDWGTWLHRRAVRLLWPTSIFVAVGATLTLIAVALGTPAGLLRQAAEGVSIILWFLAAYLGVAALTPLAVDAHDSWGTLFLAGLVAMVAAADLLRFLAGLEVVAFANYALVWGSFHQLGIAWRGGTATEGNRRPLLLAVVAAAGLVASVTWGPYPVSMITVPGAEIQNTAPPTLALLFFGMTQNGLVLILRRSTGRLLERMRLWRAVVAGNIVVMSVFLWHVLPVVIVATALWAVGATLPGPVGSTNWVGFRVVWVVLLAVVLVPVVFAVAPFERPPQALEEVSSKRGSSAASLALTLPGVAVASAGLAILTLEGFPAGDESLLPVWGVAAFFTGFALVTAGGALGRRPSARS